jgi:hypothetical protein
MAIFQYVILVSAKPGKLAEFEHWYDNEHLRDVCNVPGVRSAKRYRLLNTYTAEYAVEAAPWNSLAIYELDTDDPLALALKIKSLAGTAAMSMTSAIDKDSMVKIIGEFTGQYPPAK